VAATRSFTDETKKMLIKEESNLAKFTKYELRVLSQFYLV